MYICYRTLLSHLVMNTCCKTKLIQWCTPKSLLQKRSMNLFQLCNWVKDLCHSFHVNVIDTRFGVCWLHWKLVHIYLLAINWSICLYKWDPFQFNILHQMSEFVSSLVYMFIVSFYFNSAKEKYFMYDIVANGWNGIDFDKLVTSMLGFEFTIMCA